MLETITDLPILDSPQKLLEKLLPQHDGDPSNKEVSKILLSVYVDCHIYSQLAFDLIVKVCKMDDKAIDSDESKELKRLVLLDASEESPEIKAGHSVPAEFKRLILVSLGYSWFATTAELAEMETAGGVVEDEVEENNLSPEDKVELIRQLTEIAILWKEKYPPGDEQWEQIVNSLGLLHWYISACDGMQMWRKDSAQAKKHFATFFPGEKLILEQGKEAEKKIKEEGLDTYPKPK